MEQQQIRTNFDNEIDLMAFVFSLWKQKKLILLTTFLCILIGIVYLLFAKPVYEAKVDIFPPTLSDISAFNYGRTPTNKTLLPPFSIVSVYSLFIHNLSSKSMKQHFFYENILPSYPIEYQKSHSTVELYNYFAPQIIITEIPKTGATGFTVAVRNNSPSKATELLTRYISLVKQSTINNILKIIQTQKKNMTDNLTLKIDMARQSANRFRHDELIRLKEALTIASSLGLKEQIADTVSGKNEIYIDGTSLAYRRGTKILQLEIKSLNERQSNDAFSPLLRKLQAQLFFYKSINIELKRAAVFQLDGKIEAPLQTIMPKKAFVMLLCTLFGLMLGVTFAIMRNLLIERQRT